LHRLASLSRAWLGRQGGQTLCQSWTTDITIGSNYAMPRSPNPIRTKHTADPKTVQSGTGGGAAGGKALKSQEITDSTQPGGENGVTEDMASLALHPGLVSRAEAQTAYDGACVADAAETDAEIMLRLKAGDMSGFDFLLAKYRKPIVHFMFRMVHNQAVAEELAQEVFLRVYRARDTYRAEARFSTWLYRIATNLGVNHARDTKQERSASTIYLDETDSETGMQHDVADDEPGAEAKILRRERMNAIRTHVMALPERQRMAVLMHKYEEMDYREIGAVLKLSESATKSLLFRAYQTLREKLKEFV